MERDDFKCNKISAQLKILDGFESCLQDHFEKKEASLIHFSSNNKPKYRAGLLWHSQRCVKFACKATLLRLQRRCLLRVRPPHPRPPTRTARWPNPWPSTAGARRKTWAVGHPPMTSQLPRRKEYDRHWIVFVQTRVLVSLL